MDLLFILFFPVVNFLLVKIWSNSKYICPAMLISPFSELDAKGFEDNEKNKTQ